MSILCFNAACISNCERSAKYWNIISFKKLLRIICIVTGDNRYGLDGPGIEFRWGRDFPQPSRPTLGPTQHPIQWIPGLFPGGKEAGAWR
jgi:hypothetical protein